MGKTALLLVDIQYDFLPKGSLAVPDGDKILPPVYKLIEEADKYFNLIVASIDYHPIHHISFASTHGKEPFTAIEVPGVNSPEGIVQMLWPDHCVQGTKGCELEHGVQQRLIKRSHMVEYVRKGNDIAMDAYSVFSDNQKRPTPLARVLRNAGVTDVVVAGLATDYCVRATALDARRFDFTTTILTDAVRAVDPIRGEAVISELVKEGCNLAESTQILIP